MEAEIPILETNGNIVRTNVLRFVMTVKSIMNVERER